MPSCDKIDLDRFYQDLPKYMPFLSLSAREAWDQFKTANPVTLTSSNSLVWKLPVLHRAAVLSSQQQDSSEQSVSCETISLVAKETNTPKQVRNCNVLTLSPLGKLIFNCSQLRACTWFTVIVFYLLDKNGHVCPHPFEQIVLHQKQVIQALCYVFSCAILDICCRMLGRA